MLECGPKTTCVRPRPHVQNPCLHLELSGIHKLDHQTPTNHIRGRLELGGLL